MGENMELDDLHHDSSYLKQLKQEVYARLASKSEPKMSIFTKMSGISCAWLASYFLYLHSAASNSILYCLLATTLVFICSTALSFNFIHEGSHRPLTRSRLLNQCIQLFVSCIYGISPTNWFEKHIIRHHVYTNIHDKDFDINSKGVFRYSPLEQWRPWHSWQVYYAIPLYSLAVLKWIYFTDFRDLILNIYHLPIKKRCKILGEILITRFVHISLFIVIPSYYFSSLSGCLGYYLLFLCLSGLTTAIIFQLAHILPGLTFYADDKIHDSHQLVHQLSATANFATQNNWISFFTGGLNMQIAHHLFPYISHLEYPAINPVIKEFCLKHQLPYYEYPSFYAAIRAHLSYLAWLGQRP